MLKDIDNIKLTEHPDGTLHISVQTIDDEYGLHRFAMILKKDTYESLPAAADAKEIALKGLIKPNIEAQHAAWVARTFGTPEEPIVLQTDVSGILTTKKITI